MSSDQFLKLFSQFIRIHNQFSAVKRRMAVLDGAEALFPAEMHVLAVLHMYGPSTVSEISQYLYITKSAASQIIKKLAAKGYVDKRRVPHEERIVTVALSKSGATAAARFVSLESDTFSELKTLVESASDEQLQMVSQLFDGLEKSFDKKLQ